MPIANKPSLDTLGEIFRFAVRRFRGARLAYGHGTTNAAYGGPDGKTHYITESETGAILQARLDVPGLRLYSHQ